MSNVQNKPKACRLPQPQKVLGKLPLPIQLQEQSEQYTPNVFTSPCHFKDVALQVSLREKRQLAFSWINTLRPFGSSDEEENAAPCSMRELSCSIFQLGVLERRARSTVHDS